MRKPTFAPTRRELLASSASTLVATLVTGAAQALPANVPETPPPPRPFDRATVVELARDLAKAPHQSPATPMPDVLKTLTYDQYRDIRYRADAAIWANTDLPYRLQFFHRGFYYHDEIDIAVVDNGVVSHVAYSPNMFTLGDLVPKPVPTEDIGFAGLRVHGTINRPDVHDEIAVFLGASYFRSLGKGQIYGVSARGLALRTADPAGEEFPVFRRFWVERPKPNSAAIVVHAILDGPSVTGAYRFTIRPGMPTVMDVEATLFPRVEVKRFGLAPGTSMFMFSSNGRKNVDDYRPEVHDSDGLLMQNGRGERLWRPLANPLDLQVSAFLDSAPRGFGLIQRDRDFDNYQDSEAHYERRPSLWVEPVGDWGEGAVMLVEIPSESEIHDNIVAYWTPRNPLVPGSEYSFAYRLLWGGDPPTPPEMAIVAATRRGRASIEKPTARRLFVIDYKVAAPLPADYPLPKAQVSANAGAVSQIVVMPLHGGHGWRVTFRLEPKDAKLVELRANLEFADGRPAETWVYRWTGD